MNKILVLILILLLVAVVFYYNEHNKLKLQLSSSEKENLVLVEYINKLKEDIKNQDVRHENIASMQKSTRVRELLDSYLKDREKKDFTELHEVQIEELQDDLDNYLLKQRFIPDFLPIQGDFEISQGYSDAHKGIDMVAKLGTEVFAAGAGVLREVYEDDFFGTVAVIDHLNHYLTFYGHLLKVFPQKNMFVEKGSAFALVGKSGFTHYPHLHFEVLYKGENVNPEMLLNEYLNK